jgi:cation:H+ antiporter
MLEGTIVWSSFAALGSIIVFAGPKLSQYGDAIAEKTGLERSWIGVILLALVTSLPEVATSATAALIDLPDVVFGNVFGSNLFNVLVIAILDIMTKKPNLLEQASRKNILISSFGGKMMALALLPLVLYNIPALGIKPITLFGIFDLSSLMLMALYAVGMRAIFMQEHAGKEEIHESKEATAKLYDHMSAAKTYFLFCFFAAIIIAAGIGMSLLADIISTYEIPIDGGIPIGQSLVGIILLAVVTSLPELMVSIGAVKLGQVDMAVGNVLGSNMFNMLIIGVSDFFYHSGSILSRPTVEGKAAMTGLGSHLLIAIAGIIMLNIVNAKLSFLKKSGKRVSLSSWALVAIFVLSYVVLFFINFQS